MGLLFRPQEAHLVLASDIGVALMAAGLWYASTKIGWSMIALLYLQSYVWANHWIVAITFMHHAHPDVPKYEAEVWTFPKGAVATIDRNLGFGGKHLMHNIADLQAQLCSSSNSTLLDSRISRYYAEEATRTIQPWLRKSYLEDKRRTFWYGIWESFTKCQYVESVDPITDPSDRKYMFKPGPTPSIEVLIRRPV